ncbi:YbhB/YbcL family Raf kinase inhibitor-like protein [Lactococcus garvieae]|uniref:YbhB/YbcL family Raf kinase inhibitor-like protein n=1 Tax=Lactococcus garvieae TaxID=1363 RepID=UPI00254B12DA|nr:YbhB/YbcL family Raf kinase inhibitor-like protein [Lactococcus garvieae]
MKISMILKNNFLPDKYSKFADESNLYNEQPITSFPISVSDIPKGTKFLSLSLIDYDAIPVCGFPWIHWTVANIPVLSDSLEIPENFSNIAQDPVIQGTNSFASPFVGITDKKIVQKYVGPTPPDKDHTYSLSVTAYSEALDLKEGFYWNELLNYKNTGIRETNYLFTGRSN